MRRFRPATAILALALAACTSPQLVGTELAPPQPAPDFTLQDGLSGKTVTLSAQQGSVVVLAFLYTHCPDVCPLTAEQFRQAQQQLSAAERERTLFLAVSVDPRQDTPEAVQAFAKDHRLASGFAFLIGPLTQLQPVWKAYGIRTESEAGTPAVGHSDAIYLIDRQGRARVLTHSDISVAALAGDLKLLASH